MVLKSFYHLYLYQYVFLSFTSQNVMRQGLLSFFVIQNVPLYQDQLYILNKIRLEEKNICKRTFLTFFFLQKKLNNNNLTVLVLSYFRQRRKRRKKFSKHFFMLILTQFWDREIMQNLLL